MSNAVCSDSIYSVAAGSGRSAEWVEVFPLHLQKLHSGCSWVWGMVYILEHLCVLKATIAWVYRIIDGEEALEENNDLGLIKNGSWR